MLMGRSAAREHVATSAKPTAQSIVTTADDLPIFIRREDFPYDHDGRPERLQDEPAN